MWGFITMIVWCLFWIALSLWLGAFLFEKWYNVYIMKIITKSVIARFLRGGIASAFATMATIITTVSTQKGIENFYDLQQLGAVLIISGVIGFISGVILAGDKYYRSKK